MDVRWSFVGACSFLSRLFARDYREALVTHSVPRIPLPKDWSKHVKSGIVHVISLAQMALTAARGRASRSRSALVRQRAELVEARREILLLQDELRIKDLRMERVSPRRRPHYRATERLEILELRAAQEDGLGRRRHDDFFFSPRPYLGG